MGIECHPLQLFEILLLRVGFVEYIKLLRKLTIAEELVPSLLTLQKIAPGNAPKMKYYEGYAGVLAVLYESLQAKSEVLSYTNIGMLLEKFPETLRDFCARRAAGGQRTRIISPYDTRAEHFVDQYFPAEYVAESVQLLYVNPREFMISSEVTIFDDKVCVTTLAPEENLGVVIESQTYADTSRATFNLAWLGAGSFEAQ